MNLQLLTKPSTEIIDAPSIEIFANGISAGNFPQTFPFDGTYRPVVIHWDAQGLDVTFGGTAIATNLPVSGFDPSPGNQFAFSAASSDGCTSRTFCIAFSKAF